MASADLPPSFRHTPRPEAVASLQDQNMATKMLNVEHQIDELGNEYNNIEERLTGNEHTCHSLAKRMQSIETGLSNLIETKKRPRDDEDVITQPPIDKIAQELIRRLGQGDTLSLTLQRQIQASIPSVHPIQHPHHMSLPTPALTAGTSIKQMTEDTFGELEQPLKSPRDQASALKHRTSTSSGSIEAASKIHLSTGVYSTRSVQAAARNGSIMEETPPPTKARKRSQITHVPPEKDEDFPSDGSRASQKDRDTAMKVDSADFIPGERRTPRVVKKTVRENMVPWYGVNLSEG